MRPFGAYVSLPDTFGLGASGVAKKFKIDPRNSPKHLLVLFLFIDDKDWTYNGWKSSYTADGDAAFRSN